MGAGVGAQNWVIFQNRPFFKVKKRWPKNLTPKLLVLKMYVLDLLRTPMSLVMTFYFGFASVVGGKRGEKWKITHIGVP